MPRCQRGSNLVSVDFLSEGPLSETTDFMCLFPCLTSLFSQGLVTSETSDGDRMTRIVMRVSPSSRHQFEEVCKNSPVTTR